MRRVLDVLGALLVALVFLPVIALVALAILLTMGRPLLFRQTRSGWRGAEFSICKFRTMRPTSDPTDTTDATDAVRTTRLGTVLRTTSLDELPQLWNILRGDMGFIGPRPTLPRQVALYSSRQRGRLEVRPGVTGWAQVNGRNSLSWPERIELDLWYVEHRSWRLDLRILGRTVVQVLRPTGVVGEGGRNPDLLAPTDPSPGAAATEAAPTPRRPPDDTPPRPAGDHVA